VEILFKLVGATTIVLLILFVSVTVWHYLFYSFGYILRGKTKTVEYLSNTTARYNLLIYLYILFLLPLFVSTFFGLIDSLGFINLGEILTKIDIAFNSNIKIESIEYSIYRTVALLVSFLLVLFNLLFVLNKKYTLFIKRLFIKIIQ
jgi:hypothetical protein